MKKIYYLSTCKSCQKVMKALNIGDNFIQQDIKHESITPEQLDEMKEMAGSYEDLFSRRSMKYRQWNLKEKTLTEKDYRDLILKEYTFLKRPVVIIDDEIFIGSGKKAKQAAAEKLGISID